TGMLPRGSVLARLLGWMTRQLYRSAARVIVVGRDMQRVVWRRLGTSNKKVVIIPNWADLDEVTPEPVDRNSLVRELGLGGKFIAQYAGNMGRPNDLRTIAEAAKANR